MELQLWNASDIPTFSKDDTKNRNISLMSLLGNRKPSGNNSNVTYGHNLKIYNASRLPSGLDKEIQAKMPS